MDSWTNSGGATLIDEELVRVASIFLASPLLFVLVLMLLIYGLGQRCGAARKTAQVCLGGILLLIAAAPLVAALNQSWNPGDATHALAVSLRRTLLSRAMICYVLSVSGIAALCYLATSRVVSTPRALLWFTAPAAIGAAVLVFGVI